MSLDCLLSDNLFAQGSSAEIDGGRARGNVFGMNEMNLRIPRQAATLRLLVEDRIREAIASVLDTKSLTEMRSMVEAVRPGEQELLNMS